MSSAERAGCSPDAVLLWFSLCCDCFAGAASRYPQSSARRLCFPGRGALPKTPWETQAQGSDLSSQIRKKKRTRLDFSRGCQGYWGNVCGVHYEYVSHYHFEKRSLSMCWWCTPVTPTRRVIVHWCPSRIGWHWKVVLWRYCAMDREREWRWGRKHVFWMLRSWHFFSIIYEAQAYRFSTNSP